MNYRIFADYHTHTYFSHGSGSPRDVVETAKNKGLEAVAISEHGAGHMLYGVSGNRLVELNNEIEALKSEYAQSLSVMRGAELNVTGFGKSDAPADREAYDIIIIGFHKGVAPVNRFAAHIWTESMLGIKGSPRANTESILAAAEACRADIISHPNLYVRLDITYLADCARQLGIALEINSARVTLSDDEIKTISAHGCKLVIGSDAHIPERVGDFALASAAAERCGVWGSVINAREIAATDK